MLQTIVIAFAIAVSGAILALFFYAAHQKDLSLRRRVRDAREGGHPLSLDERIDAGRRGFLSEEEDDTQAQRKAGGIVVPFAITVGLLVAWFVSSVFDARFVVAVIASMPATYAAMFVGLFVARRFVSPGPRSI